MKLEVCLALPGEAMVIEVELEPGATVHDALEQSGLTQRHPGLDLSKCSFGSFGRLLERGDVLQPGDRLEIYRPLLADPKEKRRRAARTQER